ncbi:MAG: hypothetical protein P1U58_00555 [Verrucomicrobiales bacterium]|nr:hypothetical protein [Verrucomicrobiales bacterium]
MSRSIRRVGILLGISFVLHWTTVEAAEAPGAIYLEFEVLAEEAQKPVRELEGLYKSNLKAQRDEAVKDGQLDLVLACDTEIESIGSGSLSEPDSRWRELVRLRAIYLKSRAARMMEAEAKLERHRDSAIKRLENAIVELTKEEQIEEALKAREFLKKLNVGHEGEAAPAPAEVQFSFEEGSYFGAKIGDSEDEMRAAFKANGLKLFKTTPMSNGSKNISASGINFRVDRRGDYYQCYILGEHVALQGGLQLKKSTVEDFSSLLGERAKELDNSLERGDQFEIELDDVDLLLITTGKGETTVFSVMVTDQ